MLQDLLLMLRIHIDYAFTYELFTKPLYNDVRAIICDIFVCRSRTESDRFCSSATAAMLVGSFFPVGRCALIMPVRVRLSPIFFFVSILTYNNENDANNI